MLDRIIRSKKIVLFEPPYKRKYLPLGLAKISTLAKKNNIKTEYQRYYKNVGEDLICMTSLFTYAGNEVIESIKQIKFFNSNAKILLGGIFATLMEGYIESLKLNIDVFAGYSKELDMMKPDYDTDWGIEDKWKMFSIVFTSRGCPNNCLYCAVKKLEKEIWIVPNWKEHIDLKKPYVMISDNNLSSMPISHLEDIIKFLSDNKKSALFDNGFDCKLIDDNKATLLKKCKYIRNGLRLAFDRIEEDGIFQNAVIKLLNKGISKSAIMSYVLFNFTDKPKDAIYRMEECVKLGIRPYPQCFRPLNDLNKENNYVGKYWTKNLRNAFRYFYLMNGYYTKYKFKEFIENQSKFGDKYKFSDEDILCLN